MHKKKGHSCAFRVVREHRRHILGLFFNILASFACACYKADMLSMKSRPEAPSHLLINKNRLIHQSWESLENDSATTSSIKAGQPTHFRVKWSLFSLYSQYLYLTPSLISISHASFRHSPGTYTSENYAINTIEFGSIFVLTSTVSLIALYITNWRELEKNRTHLV